MLEFSALSSGSSGNCFWVNNTDTNSAVLIDCGISMKKASERLTSINRSITDVKAIFITHEHTDHIAGADVLSRHLKIPVFATKKTFEALRFCEEEYQNVIKKGEKTNIGGMTVESFKKNHGAADPVSYNVTKESKKVSIITDVGSTCENIDDNIKESDILCLESNHDLQLLKGGRYPQFLKDWIASDTGHLSNKQSALAVLEHARKKLKKVVLSHLSTNNNTPRDALETFHDLIKHRQDIKPQISVSTRYAATEIIKI
ncbi:MAG: MBL fold metallo-hydrolase [Nanoarchaeota archaeon]